VGRKGGVDAQNWGGGLGGGGKITTSDALDRETKWALTFEGLGGGGERGGGQRGGVGA